MAGSSFFWQAMHRMVPYLFRLYMATRSVTVTPQVHRGAVDLDSWAGVRDWLAGAGPGAETSIPVDSVDAGVAGGCPGAGWFAVDRASATCAKRCRSGGGAALVVPVSSAMVGGV